MSKSKKWKQTVQITNKKENSKLEEQYDKNVDEKILWLKEEVQESFKNLVGYLI